MKIRGFEVVSSEHRKHSTVDIQLPVRSTQDSAGYDFCLTVDTVIKPQETVVVFSDVKSYMQPNEVLMLFVRSSIGIKKNIVLANGTGIIDADYYSNPSNDGNIGLALFNQSNETVELKAGERVAQGIFVPFLVADNGNTNNVRQGGTGSTNK